MNNKTTYVLKKPKKIILKDENRCGYCRKSFTRKNFYNKHVVLCESLHKSKYKSNCDAEEKLSLPSQMDLYKIVLDLTEKYDKLNNEMKTLRNYVERTKKKINILEWLNENYKNIDLFDNWIKTIKISDSQLENTFKFGYIDGVYLILQHNFPLNNVEKHPIKSFDQKRNIFFSNTAEGWIMMEETNVMNIIRNINCKLMIKFSEWKKEHEEQIENNDRFYDKYVDYMKIILGGNLTKEQSYKKIKHKLYDYLKCDLKNIIQYEFIF